MGYLYFIVTLIFFSSMEVASVLLLENFTPPMLTFYRFAVGLIFLIGFMLLRKKHKEIFKIKASDWIMLALLGIMNTGFAMFLLQLAVYHTNPPTAATLFCTNPIFILLFAIMRKQENFSLTKMLSFILCFLGIPFIIFQKNLNLHSFFNPYSWLALVASILFALYSTLNKEITQRVSSITANVISFSFGLPILLVVNVFSAKNIKDFIFPVEIFSSATKIFLFLYLSFGVSGLAYITFMLTLKHFKASSASLIFFLKPVIATFLSIIFLETKLSPSFFIGLIIISLASLFLIMGQKLSKKTRPF